MKELSIIMPMYNAVNIKGDLNEANNALAKITNRYEIILVNDGSENNCFNVAKEYSKKNKKVQVVGYKKNSGKGSAIKYGFKFVSGKYVAFVDTGGELNPEQLKKFIKIMEDEKADVVIGSKRHVNSDVHYPLIRRFMSSTYQLLNKILFNLGVKDTQVGIKLFKKEILDKVIPKIAIKRFAFDLELLVIANKKGYEIVEAPITMKYKFKSTISPSAVFWMLWDTAAIFYRLKILKYYD